MTDYSAPLIELREWDKHFAQAMRLKRYEAARYAALRMLRLSVDLLELAEKFNVVKPT